MTRTAPRTVVAALAVLLFCLRPAELRADDVADEADLRFQLGAEAYQRGDYRDALQHFLASNRLVPNRNVVFNIARTYEKLRLYPEAYRYFTQAAEAEKDEAARRRIEAALSQIEPFVAVVEVQSAPAGATVYVNRKDLGPRGETPRKLGLSPGDYTILLEREGYEPIQTTVRDVKAGRAAVVSLKMKQILGKVAIEGAQGAEVRADDEGGPPLCVAPCTAELPPGPHTLYVGRAGFRTVTLPIEVRARSRVTVRPDVQAVTGELVVSTDEPGALIEVDGKPVGFTPTIAKIPIGRHRVRLGLRGFRNIERDVVIAKGKQTRLDVTLSQSEEVIAASRSTQAVEDAPSSVTLIPEKELRVFAYPTIAEALRGVRGLYVWDDRAYVSAGVRGLGRLGNYGNRLLVLVDGHPTNDNWIGSSYLGYDGRTDLADLERIEVVRGPGSVLYGTNAFSGVINLVSRSRGVPPGGEVGVSTNLDGVARGRGRANFMLGEDSGAWVSAAGARSSGRDFFFPELVATTPPEVAGNARGVDGFEAGSVAGRAWWRFLSVQGFFHTHEKQLPTGIYDTLLGDERNRQRDSRAFVEATAEPKLGKAVSLYTRAHWNHYRFDGYYARDPADGGLERDRFRGSWVGVEQRVVLSPSDDYQLTAGGEGQLHYQVDQKAWDETGTFLDEEGGAGRPYQVGAAYLLADARLGEAFRLSGGARFDAYSTFGNSINPRLALLVRPYSSGNLKLLGGKAFRAPSVYELYYNDGGATQVASPDLQPESIYSVELEHTHRFSPTVSGTAAVFASYVKDLIDVRGAGDSTDPLHYVNSASPLLSLGGELELRREWRQGWMVAASYSYQRSTYLAGSSTSDALELNEDPSRRRVANSPEHLGSLKAAVPISGRDVTLGSRVSAEGPRHDRYELDADPPQRRVSGAVIWDVVFSGAAPRWGLRWAAGVYNAFDWRYSAPVSAELVQRRIVQNGRTALFSADVSF